MGRTKDEPLTPEQITDAKRLCEVIVGVPGTKRSIFEIVMLTYMNGFEAGAVYAKDVSTVAAR